MSRSSSVILLSFILPAALALGSVGCQSHHSSDSTSNVTAMPTSKSQLVESKGEPDEVVDSQDEPSSKIYHFKKNETFQVQNEKVIAHFRDPAPDETDLQVWRHRWAGLNAVYLPMDESEDAHGRKDYVLKVDSIGKAVIYDPDRDQVIRVVEYEH